MDSLSHTFGDELRRERVVRGISLEEIARATKISVRLLAALESSDVSRLPAAAFTRGFIRAYARHLGIDPEEKVNAYIADLKNGSTKEAPAPKRARPRSRFLRGRRGTAGTIVGSVTAILLLLGFIANPERRPVRTASVRAARVESLSFRNVTVSNEPTPAIRLEIPSSAPMEGTPEVSQRVLLLECDADSWAKLLADGVLVFSGLIRRGETHCFQARGGFLLTLGNAGGVRVTVDGRRLQKLGGVGEVIRDVSLPAGQQAFQGLSAGPGPPIPPSSVR